MRACVGASVYVCVYMCVYVHRYVYCGVCMKCCTLVFGIIYIQYFNQILIIVSIYSVRKSIIEQGHVRRN